VANTFTFRLESLLKYRRYRRDRIRALFADMLLKKETLEQQLTELMNQRQRQLDELRTLAAKNAFDVSAASARRFHAGRLARESQFLKQHLQQVEEQVQLCRAELQTAERDVEVLTRLKQKQHKDFEYQQNRREQLELEEAWLSARTGEYSP